MRYPVPSREDEKPDEKTSQKETESGGNYDECTCDSNVQVQVTVHIIYHEFFKY
jgi:hypothetical protein